jgi:hypothetical protein
METAKRARPHGGLYFLKKMENSGPMALETRAFRGTSGEFWA